MTQRPTTTFRSGKGPWVRFAMGAGERWLTLSGRITTEMRQFGSYLRQMRYRQGYSIRELSDELEMPYEDLLMLEVGLLKPSEVPSPVWVRLMRLLEGREVLVRRTYTDEAEAELDPDELWAEGDDDPSGKTALGLGQTLGVASIKVVGVGGGGSNAVRRMFQQRVPGVEYIAVNTDAQHLIRLDVPRKVRIGDRLTRGLGVGGNPELGREAAEESREDLYDLLSGTDLVFVAAGMGGGTGTGAAPVVAEIAKEVGALTIAVVTKPFGFEGQQRSVQADEGIARLREHVDTLILIPNDRLYAVSDERMTAENAFRIADDVLRQGVQSISELVMVAGDINLDFADIRAVMAGAGSAWMAIGHGRGRDRAYEAARAAMASPLLHVPVEGATRVLLNITYGPDVTLQEVYEASDIIKGLVDPHANIIFGMITDQNMEDEVRVTVVATGLTGGESVVSQSLDQILQGALDSSESNSTMPGFLQRIARFFSNLFGGGSRN